MIFTTLIIGFFGVVEWILSLLPSIPAMITTGSLTDFTNLIFDNLGLIDLVIPIQLLTSIITLMISTAIAKLVISIIMWILKKIPVASIQ